jgi:hypothetical protein
MTKPVLLVAALAVAAPLWLAGCGDDGGGQPSGSEVAARLVTQLPVIDPEATCEKLEGEDGYRCTVSSKGSSTTLTYRVTCGPETCAARNEAGGPSQTFPLEGTS